MTASVKAVGGAGLDDTPTLEAQGQLHAMLLEAEEKTKDEMIELTQQFRKQGLTAQQAHDRAWEMVRESYILLPAES